MSSGPATRSPPATPGPAGHEVDVPRRHRRTGSPRRPRDPRLGPAGRCPVPCHGVHQPSLTPGGEHAAPRGGGAGHADSVSQSRRVRSPTVMIGRLCRPAAASKDWQQCGWGGVLSWLTSRQWSVLVKQWQFGGQCGWSVARRRAACAAFVGLPGLGAYVLDTRQGGPERVVRACADSVTGADRGPAAVASGRQCDRAARKSPRAALRRPAGRAGVPVGQGSCGVLLIVRRLVRAGWQAEAAACDVVEGGVEVDAEVAAV
jgi:hypothetical protein